MITSPTVLILGAGSNVDYGFPTGDQLRMDIIRELGPRPEPETQPKQRESLHKHLLSTTSYEPLDLIDFAREFKESSDSIDLFLERNPSYEEIGYRAIAYVLTRYEQGADLYRTDRPRWYDYLWRTLDQGHSKSPSKQLLSIITFNYDRSLEHYLAMAFKWNYHLDDVQLGQSLSRLQFIHLYGTIGGQPYIDQHSIPFGDTSHIKESASTIKIIKRKTDDDVSDAFKAAHEEISKAKYIFFLGFGFDSDNCERLAIKKHFDFKYTDPRIFATALEMPEGTRNVNRNRLGLNSQECYMHDGDCLGLLGNVTLQRP